MEIDRTGWSNVKTRSYGGVSDIPEKVFIQSEHSQLPGNSPQYEYSELPPAHTKWSIEDLLCGHYGRQNFITLFYCLPEVFAPVNEIASRVADAVWQLRKEWNDEVDYKNADFNRLFSSPNPLMSHKQFVWQAVCYEILCGANIEYFNKPSTLPDEIGSVMSWWNAPTHRVKIDKKKNVDTYSATSINDFVNAYYALENGHERRMDIANVLPLMNLDLQAGNQIDKFKSQLHGAHLAIKNLIPVYEARGVIYIKRGALGFLVSRKSDDSGLVSLTKGEKEEAQQNFQQTYGLSAGKHQVAVTAAPVEYISTSMSIQELQPFDETLADAVAIYKVLRVPRHFVPSKETSTYANADSDTVSFYDDVIIPMAHRYAQAWTTYFNIDRRYIYPDFSHIKVLQRNRKEKAEVDKTNGATMYQRWTSGAITLNEWIVSFDGTKGVGNIYEKKFFDLTPEEIDLVKNVLNLKQAVKDTVPQTDVSTQ